MGRWNNQIVWVTGASSGIGKACAESWARRGATVVLSARKAETLDAVASPLRDNGADVHVVTLDLSNSDSLQAVAQHVEEKIGPVDVMVHCGGISQRSKAIETALDVDRRVMEIDYFGTLALTKALLPGMVKRGRGHFVVVTSLMGLFSSPLRSGYCGAKHALHGFFESLRAEHHDDGLKVTMVCPGFIRTNISLNAVVGDGSQQGTMDAKTGAGMTAEQCAERMVKAVERNKAEVLIGRYEILAAYIKRLSPALLRRIVRRAAVT
ncbi:MAG: SDR family oxidoreductase [Bacteroidota bacterium]|nr:SDR family oxidoreductase [Bacteroidota bacterium]